MSAIYEGFETTIKHSFGEFSNLTFNFTHELAFSNFASLPGVTPSGGIPPGTDALANSIPKNNVSLLYSQRMHNDLAFSAAYYLQTSLQGFDRGPTDFQPTHRRVDMRLSRPFKGHDGLRGEVTGVVQNLFQTDYTEYVATALDKRRAFVTLTFRWQ